MATYNDQQLQSLWVQAGGSPSLAPTMAAIALAESSGNPNALNPTDNNGKQTSWGLWQISNGTHNAPTPDILTPQGNASAAVAKYASQGLGAWGTYDSHATGPGSYLSYLSQYPDYTATGASLVQPNSGQSGQVVGNQPNATLAFDWTNPLGSAASSAGSAVGSAAGSALSSTLGLDKLGLSGGLTSSLVVRVVIFLFALAVLYLGIKELTSSSSPLDIAVSAPSTVAGGVKEGASKVKNGMQRGKRVGDKVVAAAAGGAE